MKKFEYSHEVSAQIEKQLQLADELAWQEFHQRMALQQYLRTLQKQETASIHPLIEVIRQRFGDSLLAILYYGSTRRSANPQDGLVDLYAVVDDYQRAWRNPLLAWANYWLPPNVIYLETPLGLRCKCAVIRIDHFQAQMKALHPYFWGRFCQPFALVYYKEGIDKIAIEISQLTAIISFIKASLSLLKSPFNADELWRTGLAASYHSELRAERHSRLDQLAQFDAKIWRKITVLAAPLLPLHSIDAELFNHQLNEAEVHREQQRWQWRRRIGIIWSLMRLTKAVFTFQNGVEYGLWKIERHTGERMSVPTRVKRWPLIFGWPYLWRLYRRGLLR